TVMAAALVAAPILTGCSLKSKERHVIRIELPSGASVNQSSVSSLEKNLLEIKNKRTSNLREGAVELPESFDDFTCLAINVTGSGIADDPRARCYKEDRVGRIGGFVSMDGGIIEVDVPSGPGRRIQLFGVKSYIGCPSVDSILDSMVNANTREFEGFGEPFLLGEAYVDVFSDVSVPIEASFDPLYAVRLFDDCGEQDRPIVPMAGAYRGSSVNSELFSVTPSYEAGATEIRGDQLTFEEMQVLSISDWIYGGTSTSGTDTATRPLALDGGGYNVGASNVVRHAAYGDGGQRAVMQLQWDVSYFDLAKFSMMHLVVPIAGGASGGSCVSNAGDRESGAMFAVYDKSMETWLPSTFSNSVENLAVGEFHYNPERLVVTKSDGHRYIIANIESNYLSSSENCQSVVGVGGVRLELAEPVEVGNTVTGEALRIEPTELTMSVGETVYFYATGGVPPYRFSVIEGGGTIEGYNGTYTAPRGPTAAVIAVIDSVETRAIANVTVSEGAVSSIVLDGLGGTVTAGAQNTITVTMKDADGNTVAGYTGEISFESNDTQFVVTDANGSVRQDGAYYKYTFIVEDRGTTSFNVTFKTAGTRNLSVSNGITNRIVSDINVAVDAASRLVFVAQPPATISGGVGFGVRVGVQDQWGNTVTTSTPSISISIKDQPIEIVATLFGATTVSAVNGVAMFSGLKIERGGDGYTLEATADTASGLGSVVSDQFSVQSPKLVFITSPQTVAAGNCSGVVTIQSQDGNGAAFNVSGAVDVAISVSAWAGIQFFSDLNCSGTPVFGISIPASTSSNNFYFKQTTVGSVIINATASGWQQGTQTNIINAGAASKLEITGPVNGTAGLCAGPFTVSRLDSLGNPSAPATSVNVNRTDGGSGGFYEGTDSECVLSQTGGTITISNGQSSASFYYKSTTAG
ncbi:MAG: hypothetical protein AABZ06_07040, partial [Bdellovibrionota bacterium]